MSRLHSSFVLERAIVDEDMNQKMPVGMLAAATPHKLQDEYVDMYMHTFCFVCFATCLSLRSQSCGYLARPSARSCP